MHFAMTDREWRLIDTSGKPIVSAVPGAFAANRRSRVYGRFDCPGAARALARGSYQKNRVFFADEATAQGCGLPALRRLHEAKVTARLLASLVLVAALMSPAVSLDLNRSVRIFGCPP